MRYWVHFSPLSSPVSQQGHPTFTDASKGPQEACLCEGHHPLLYDQSRMSQPGESGKSTLSGGATSSGDNLQLSEAQRAHLHC